MRFVCVLVLIVAPLSLARADATGEEQARTHFRAGQAEYARGHYREALDEFRLGYALSPRPEFLLNFAQAYRKLGEFERAIVECERFLATAPPEPLQSEAQRLLLQLREEQARAAMQAPPDMAQPAPAPPEPPRALQQPAPPAVVAPHPSPPPAATPHRRRWVVPVAVGVTLAVVAGGAIALGVILSQHDTYPSAPLGAVDFR